MRIHRLLLIAIILFAVPALPAATMPAAAQESGGEEAASEATETVVIDEEGGDITITDIEIVRTSDDEKNKNDNEQGGDAKDGDAGGDADKNDADETGAAVNNDAEKRKEDAEVSIKTSASVGFYGEEDDTEETEEPPIEEEVTIGAQADVAFDSPGAETGTSAAGDETEADNAEEEDAASGDEEEKLFRDIPEQELGDVLDEALGNEAAAETDEAAAADEAAGAEEPETAAAAEDTTAGAGAGETDEESTDEESPGTEEMTADITIEASPEEEPADAGESTEEEAETTAASAPAVTPPVMPAPSGGEETTDTATDTETAVIADETSVEFSTPPLDAATAGFATAGFDFGTDTFMTGESTGTPLMPGGPRRYTGPRTTSIENEFIHIDVNTMPVDTGRFLVKTVEGDPFRETDDNKILIYGGAVPWTSFTTIRVDGENYVFGGPTHRRAGRNAMYGEVLEGPEKVDEKAITTTCEINGLEVTQTLSIVGGPISRLLDTVRINTVVRNTSMEPHRVGVRLVIDTLLGSNDGSPFKVGEQSITSETELSGNEIQDYWIAYDSLEDPGVVARGTLRGPGLTTPDRVLFSNWGKLADHEWEPPFNPGQSFQREGEAEMDSATALYWEESTIMPDGELQFTTLYGIEYLNVAGEILSIGAVRNLGEWSTAKNQIRPYTLYGYIGNSSEIELNNVRITMQLPDGLEFAGDDTGARRLGRLEPGSEATVGWVVQPKVAADGEKTIKIVGHAREVEDVELRTTVGLLAPPGIDTTVIAPERIERSPIDRRDYGPYGPPFPVKIRCYNKGTYHIDNLRVKLILPDGLVFPRIHKSVQTFPRLEGKSSVEFSWKVIATGERAGRLDYGIEVVSDSTEAETITGMIEVEPLPITIAWTGVPETTYKGTFIPAELYVTDGARLASAELSVEFDPEVLQVVRVSQGTLFVEKGLPLPWRDPDIDNRRGLVSGIEGRRTVSTGKGEGSLVILHFMAKKPGISALEALGLRLRDFDGNAIEDFTFLPMSITVDE